MTTDEKLDVLLARTAVLEAAVLALVAQHPQRQELRAHFEAFVASLNDLQLTSDASSDGFSSLLSAIRSVADGRRPGQG